MYRLRILLARLRNAFRDQRLIAILAVGIGAATAIYGLIDACLHGSNTYPLVDRREVVRASG
jgi:hypothetical protein